MTPGIADDEGRLRDIAAVAGHLILRRLARSHAGLGLTAAELETARQLALCRALERMPADLIADAAEMVRRDPGAVLSDVRSRYRRQG